MFIVFDTSLLIDIDNESTQYKKDLLYIFDNARYSMKHGLHYVSTSKSELAKNISIFAQNNDEKKIALVFDYIYLNFSILNAPKEHLKYYVVIGKYESPICFIGNEIRINYLIAKKNEFWEKTRLLPENLGDHLYLLRIVNYIKDHSSIDSIKTIKFDYEPIQGGGGENIKQEFEENINNNHFIFAILDSDKKSPSSCLGSTASFFETDPDIFSYKNKFYYILNVHEIENLFSSDEFMSLSKYTQNERRKISEIESMSIQDSQDFRAYLDIKKGYTFKSVEDNSYLIDLLNDEILRTSCPIPNCSPCKTKGCVRKLLEGASSSYMDDLFNNPNFEAIFEEAASTLIPRVKNEWENITKYFITACCANKVAIVGVN